MHDVGLLGAATHLRKSPHPTRRLAPPEVSSRPALPRSPASHAKRAISRLTFVPRQSSPGMEVRACSVEHDASRAPADKPARADRAPRTLRVLIIDDLAESRELTRWQLETDPSIDVVGEAADGRTGIAAAARLRPDVVILDLYMPHQGGFQTLPVLRERVPEAQVIVLTVLDSPAARRTAAELGAANYAVKGASRQRLIEAVRQTTTHPGDARNA